MPKPSTPYPQSDRELLRLVERSPGHRAGYKQLIRELGLGGGRERRLLLEQLARMTLRKELVKLDTGHWTLPGAARAPENPGAPRLASETWASKSPRNSATRENLIAGRLDVHRDGFGFVRPTGSSKREDDLFIPPHDLNGAMQGDEVLVDEAPPGRPGADGKPRRSGRIARILTRPQPHGRRHLPLQPPRKPTAGRRTVAPGKVPLRHPARRAHDAAHPDPHRPGWKPRTPRPSNGKSCPGRRSQARTSHLHPRCIRYPETLSSFAKGGGPASPDSVPHSSQPHRDEWDPATASSAAPQELSSFATGGGPASLNSVPHSSQPHRDEWDPATKSSAAPQELSSFAAGGGPAPLNSAPHSSQPHRDEWDPATKSSAAPEELSSFATGGGPASLPTSAQEASLRADGSTRPARRKYPIAGDEPQTASSSPTPDLLSPRSETDGSAVVPGYDPTLPHPLEGLAVDVEITDFPTLGRPARGRLLEILGDPEAFGVDVEIVIRKHHLPHVFPANVLTEAEDSARDTVAAQTDDELAYRVDFRGLPIVTIDGETARDFDDAVLVQPLPNGNWQLQVHIADVSHYVRPGTDLDLEARLRGTSVYFPDRAVPMLPPALSSGICSLRPDEDRLVLSCVAEIDARGEVVEYKLCEGIIRSAARLTYKAVQAILDEKPLDEIPTEQVVHATPARSAPNHSASASASEIGPGFSPDTHTTTTTAAPLLSSRSEAEGSAVGSDDTPSADPWSPLIPQIKLMLELAQRLNRKRHRRGSIDFDLPEPVIRFDPQGNMAAITRSERGWSNRLIEEFMLTANECVAHWLEGQGDSIYRIHELPDPKRILDFEEVAATYGQTLGFPSVPVKQLTMKSDRRQSRSNAERFGGKPKAAKTHDIPESIPVTPQMYQKLSARIAGTPEERILSYLMLRSLKQARYSEKNEGHFALASPSYTHFTSPIRRYPDLIVHRLLRAALREGADPQGEQILSTDPQPWSSKKPLFTDHGPSSIPLEELQSIATESSQSERRADDAERELMEGKKLRFMEPRIGEEFHATVLSCTKYGFYVELDDLFIEGLVPIQTIADSLPFGDPDRFVFRDTDRVIVGTHSGRVFRLGQRVHVLLDRIDRPNRRLQFALVPSREPQGEAPRSFRKPRAVKPEQPSPDRTGKPAPKGRTKSRTRDRKAKGKGKRK